MDRFFLWLFSVNGKLRVTPLYGQSTVMVKVVVPMLRSDDLVRVYEVSAQELETSRGGVMEYVFDRLKREFQYSLNSPGLDESYFSSRRYFDCDWASGFDYTACSQVVPEKPAATQEPITEAERLFPV